MKRNTKTMFVSIVAFFVMLVGFVLALPKQMKAAPPQYPCTIVICCPDGDCHYCFCQSENDRLAWFSLLCIESEEDGPGTPGY